MLRIVALFVALLLVGGVVSCGGQNVGLDNEPTRNASAGEWYDGTTYWNNISMSHNFRRVTPGLTFQQAYFGTNFATDFAAITAQMNAYFGAMPMGTPGTEPGGVDTMGTPGVEPGGVDTMSTTISNWGLLYWGL